MEYSISAGGYATIAVGIIKSGIIYEAQFIDQETKERQCREFYSFARNLWQRRRRKKKEGGEGEEKKGRERERGRKKIALLRIRGVRTSPDREGMQLKNSSRRRIIDSFVSAEQEDIISVLLLANSSSNQPIPLPPPPSPRITIYVLCVTRPPIGNSTITIDT